MDQWDSDGNLQMNDFLFPTSCSHLPVNNLIFMRNSNLQIVSNSFVTLGAGTESPSWRQRPERLVLKDDYKLYDEVPFVAQQSTRSLWQNDSRIRRSRQEDVVNDSKTWKSCQRAQTCLTRQTLARKSSNDYNRLKKKEKRFDSCPSLKQ